MPKIMAPVATPPKMTYFSAASAAFRSPLA
jgi:hypothetical protein